MTHPYRTINYDTSGTGGAQQSNNGLRLTDAVTAAVKTVTPTVSLVRSHPRTIQQTNPAGAKYL